MKKLLMNTEKIMMLINPHAGLLKPSSIGPREMKYLAGRELPGAAILETGSEAEAEDAVKRGLREGFEIIAGVGGDGTARQIAGLLAGTNMAMGLVPMGSAGNVARSLGLPVDVMESLRLLKRGHTRMIDVGYAGSEHFLEAAGVGFHADTLALYNRNLGKSLVRTLHSLSRAAEKTTPFHAEIQIGDELHEFSAIQITFSNMPFYGTGFHIAPGADFADGKLHITVIKEMPVFELPAFSIMVAAGGIYRSERVGRLIAESARVRTEIPKNVHADAHIAGETPMDIFVKKETLKVVVK